MIPLTYKQQRDRRRQRWALPPAKDESAASAASAALWGVSVFVNRREREEE